MAVGRVVEEPLLQDIGTRHRKSPAQVALRWLIQQDGVVAIPKAATGRHREANLDIFDFSLEAEEMEAIHGLARPDGRTTDPEGLAPEWD